MSTEPLNESVLFRTVSDLVGDLADLFQKEIRLAKAEISAGLNEQLHAGFWMIVAGICALFTAILVLQAIVFGLIAAGLQSYWACLITAIAMAGAGALAFYRGRSNAAASMAPRRTMHQVREDIKTVKEQLG